MMKQTKPLLRRFVSIIVLGTILCLSALIFPGTTQAASHTHARANCVTSFSNSPITATEHVNQDFTLWVHVHCPTAGFIDVGITWGDGSHDDIWCGNPVFQGCNDGDALADSHTYKRTGKFVEKTFTTTVQANPTWTSFVVIA